MVRHLGKTLLAAACVVGLILACFGPAFDDARQLAYRDFSDFYYPIYQRVQQEWEAGRLPLWASEENGGSPMLGNPTSAVLYPGKLIYAALPYPRAAKAYVVAHVLLAFGAMVALLRRSGVSAIGSTLGGLAYAFGAPVLTQYSNIVFLVGAAWMPLGFLFADGWVRLRRPRALAGLALVLAMQVLGGDPEAAYLTAFASAAYALGRRIVGEPPGRARRIALAGLGLVLAYAGLLWLEIARLPRPGSPTVPIGADHPWWRISPSTAGLIGWGIFGVVAGVRWMKWRRRAGIEGSLLGLLGACVLAAALAGAQLVPTLEFVAGSTRGEESPHFDMYAHSIHPARAVEWAWPNAFGSTRQTDHNWLTALPPTEDHRVWMTSIYLGGLTLLLAVGGAWSGVHSPIRRWMVGVALVGVLAGFGPFAGPLFWARAASGAEAGLGALEPPEPELPRADGRLRDGDGGPYWFLASALPGFRSFRYPGKLFVPAALGVAALAGIGFDGLVAGRRRVGSAMAMTLLVIGLAGLGLTVIRPDSLLRFLEGRADAAASAFGPFSPSGAAVDLRAALAHGTAVMVAFLILARLAPTHPGASGLLALAVMAVDLAVANRGQISTISQAAYEGESRVLAAIRRSELEHPGNGPFRIFRINSWAPFAWQRSFSTERHEEIVRWERETLKSKYEQPRRVASTFAFGTVELADYGAFFEPFWVLPGPELIRRRSLPEGRRVNCFPRRGFDLWNTRYFIAPNVMIWGNRSRGFGSFLPEAEPIYPTPFAGPDGKARLERWGLEEDVQVFRNLAAYPRAWVVHRAIPVGVAGVLTRPERWALMTALLYQDDELWHIEGRQVADPRQVAWVEAPATKLAGLAGASEGSEPVKVIESDDPTRVELEVSLRSPGLVVLAEVFYPGWRLEIDGRPAEILRVDRMMRGAVVPAGPHRLVYTYRPGSLTVGVAFSGIGLLAWLALLTFGRSGDGIANEGRPA
jgi:hypothetical protein